MHVNPKSFLKRILKISVAIVILNNPAHAQTITDLPENQLVLPANTYSIAFKWQGDTVHSVWEPHAAIVIPVKFKNCPRQFYMQFDLGAPCSLFYQNKLESIKEKYPKIIPLDKPGSKLVNFSFMIDKMPILAKEISVQQFDTLGIDWKNKNVVEIIGTIGTDLIDGKVVVIDYPERHLVISENISEELQKNLLLNDFVYSRRSVLLPAKIIGKETMLYFDTGSSMFELLTDEETCRQLAAPGAKSLQSKVKSWNRFLTANSIATKDSISIAGKKIPIRYSTYIEGISSTQFEQMRKLGIGGMTGNKLFLHYKLVLDTRNRKFGLVAARHH